MHFKSGDAGIEIRVEIKYYSFDWDEINKRVIDPYRIAFKDGFWYLVAFCHLWGDDRLSRVDWIKHIPLLTDKFTTSPESLQKQHWNIAWGIEMGEEYIFRSASRVNRLDCQAGL